MILEGNQRGFGRKLAWHLLNPKDNDHVVVHEVSGFLANNLYGAFREAEALSLGTKCEQYLFSLSLNPPQSASVSVEEYEEAISEIERRLGLSGQPRAIVFHEKKGRRHAHCVWSRIVADDMQAINLPHYKRRLMDISRELYREHGWEMPEGFIDHEKRDPRKYSNAEAGQAKRVKRDPAELKELFKACWASSDSRAAFAAALWEKGFCLARGDRRGFVAVDADGEVYSLSRWCGVKARKMRERLGDNDDLPSVEDAVDLLNEGKSYEKSLSSARHDQEHHRALQQHDEKHLALVARQRYEREALSKTQELRRTEELKYRQSRLPTGLKATWARLTGKYQHQINELAFEAQASSARDLRETQALIDRHLAERRELGREHDFLEAQQALEREVLDKPVSALGRVYHPDPLQPLVLPREIVPFTQAQLKRKPELILPHISDKKARFSRTDITRGLAEFIDDPLDLRVASDKVLASPELIHIDCGNKELFTTRDYQTIEAQLAACATDMAKLGGFRVKATHIDRAIKRQNIKLKKQIGANLSEEQVNAINHVLAPNQLCSVVGLAGSGKSTLLSVAREAWERQGITVHGATLAGKAADSLQTASGIKSRTLASLEASWKSGYEPIACGDVVVIDEAGMVGTRQLARIAQQLRERGCKLVLVGDPDQLQPIEAGTPFKNIIDKTGAARLTEIRRQKTDWQRQASRDLADGHTTIALQDYLDHGAVHEATDRDKAITSLVEGYMADWQSHGSTKSRLALAHRRKDVHAINQAIKSARWLSGEAATGTLFETDHGPRSFAKGDRILFTRNDATLGVRNGMLGTVEDVGGKKLTVQFDTDVAGNCRKLTFKPREFPSFDHGFAVSIHRSQGCTVDRSFVLASQTLDKNLAYVALTRHREETGFYTSPDIAPRRLGLDLKTSPIDPFRPRGPSRRR